MKYAVAIFIFFVVVVCAFIGGYVLGARGRGDTARELAELKKQYSELETIYNNQHELINNAIRMVEYSSREIADGRREVQIVRDGIVRNAEEIKKVLGIGPSNAGDNKKTKTDN